MYRQDNLDRLDAYDAYARKLLKGHEDGNNVTTAILGPDWSYTKTLAIYVNAVEECHQQGSMRQFVPVEHMQHAQRHQILYAFVFGPSSISKLDPSVLYRKRRIDGHRILEVHPALDAYVQTLHVKVRQTGGRRDRHCIKGRGKAGSYVFTVDCMNDLVPGSISFRDCLYSGQTIACTLPDLYTRHSTDSLLKVNKDVSDTSDELAANKKVWTWMARQHFLNYTPLHALSSHVVTMSAAGQYLNTLVVFRRMDGDVSKLDMTFDEIAAMTKAILIVIHVIHENGHVHLDVKPANVLYTRQSNAAMSFALADYGILEDSNKVLRDLKEGVFSGTYGTMSPLLLDYRDDGSNKVYPVFAKVAAEARGASRQYTEENLADMFQGEKNKFRAGDSLAKVDLHSLGLTLYKIIGKSTQLQQQQRKVLVDYVYRCMFFDVGLGSCFSNTFQAISYLCKDMQSSCKDIGIVSKK